VWSLAGYKIWSQCDEPTKTKIPRQQHMIQNMVENVKRRGRDSITANSSQKSNKDAAVRWALDI